MYHPRHSTNLLQVIKLVNRSWPLYTRAKSRDHDIVRARVRAQNKVSIGRPNTPPESCSVVTDPQVLCEVICVQTLNHSMIFYSCGVLMHDKINKNQRL